MPAPESATPAKTPYADQGAGQPIVESMTDAAILEVLRKGFVASQEAIAFEFFKLRPGEATDLAAFKTFLHGFFIVDSEGFEARYLRLEARVIEDLAPHLYSGRAADIYAGEAEDESVASIKPAAPPPSPTPPAASATSPVVPAQAADPVNLFNGEFVHSIADFQINGAGIDFIFVRSYSQLATGGGPLGYNWDHAYNLWLRVDEDGRSVMRSTGAMRQQAFRRHDHLDYWVPPDGELGCLFQDVDGAYVFRQPDGVKIVYAPHQTLQPFFHIVSRIEDRFGNALRFHYTDGLLTRAEVNHPDRLLYFTYDGERRIQSVRDFTGRTWRYEYDTLGDLVAATTPATAMHPRGATTRYEYTGVAESDLRLRHNLLAILDADGRLYLENEYGARPDLLTYRRVVRQRQGGGEVSFDYADVVEEFDQPYAAHERPTQETIVRERDGRQVRFLLNQFGNILLKEQYAWLEGIPKLIHWHFRYNRDGRLVGTLSPLGVVTQALYGRDDYERRFPRDEDYQIVSDPNLTAAERSHFGVLLAVVQRASYHNVTAASVAGGLWSAGVFPDVWNTDDEDVVRKFSYDPEFAQPLTASDARFTRSVDPRFVEDAEYYRRLTRYIYASGPGGSSPFQVLAAIELPAASLPDGSSSPAIVTRFTDYDGRGRLLSVTSPNGLRTVNEYAGPSDGLLEGFLTTTTIDPGGFDMRRGVERDRLGRVTKLRRPPSFASDAGNRFSSTNEYDELSRVVCFTGSAPFSVTTRNSYTRAGGLARSETDVRDDANRQINTLVTSNHYDEELKLVGQTQGDGAGSVSRQTRAVFDSASRPALKIGPSGRKQRVLYNERSLVARVIDDYGGSHATTRAFYDADGRLARVTNARGFVSTFTYDALGRLIQSQDAQGNCDIRHFDKLGDLIVECRFERHAEDAFVLLSRGQFTYDELGRPSVTAVNRFDKPPPPIAKTALREAFTSSGPGELLSVQSYYDAIGNLVKSVDPDSRTFRWEYDLLGRLARRIDPLGNEVRLEHDTEGNVVRVDATEFTRDPATSTVTATRCFASSFVYDELNRLVERRTPTGVWTYRYDSRGNQVSQQDPLQNRIEDKYDVFGRLGESRRSLHQYEPDATGVTATTWFGYDLDDQLTVQTDAQGRKTEYRYDSAGRLVATILPDGSSDAVTYDRCGNVTEYCDRNGLLSRFTWDSLNRNVATDIDPYRQVDGEPTEGATAYRCEFNASGQITTAANDFAVLHFSYDSLGLPLTESVSFTAATGLNPTAQYVIRREYTNTGALASLVYPSGREVRYGRDALDRIVSVEQVNRGAALPGGVNLPDQFTIATLHYDGLRPSSLTRHNGVSTSYRYDFAGRIIEMTHADETTDILRFQFLYDALGNLRQRTEVSPMQQVTERFQYDSFDQLIAATTTDDAVAIDFVALEPPATPLPATVPQRQAKMDSLLTDPANTDTRYAYKYDLVGNRVRTTSPAAAVLYETNVLDQYTHVDGAGWSYDAAGNLIDDGIYAYRYDHRGQLVRMQGASGTIETQRLRDFFGRSCVERDASRSSVVLYDAHNLLEEYDAAVGVDGGRIVRSVVSEIAMDRPLLCSNHDGSQQYFLTDLTRSVRCVFDGSQRRSDYTYDSFGNPMSEQPVENDGNPFRFAGKRQLGETGKYDFVYRVYDPAAGRFLQRDPMGFVDGINLYTFVRNNPLTHTDPFGTDSRSELFSTAGVEISREIARRHPKGFTLAVPNSFEREKMRAYKERIQNPNDRGVGIRGEPPGGGSRTKDLRARNQHMVDGFVQDHFGGVRPPGVTVDHTVELQNIIRGNETPGADTVRRKDHRAQGKSLNSSQGSANQKVIKRQIAGGAPEDTPAGGVVRERDMNKLWNRPGYRTTVRTLGYAFTAKDLIDTLMSLDDAIREGDFASAGLATSGYLGGALEVGGLVARSPTLLRYGRILGAPAAVIGSGLIGIKIGTNLYENYVDKERMMDAGAATEELTGSRFVGGLVAAGVAVDDAINAIPEAAYDYAAKTWTLDSDKIDWGRTFNPFRW